MKVTINVDLAVRMLTIAEALDLLNVIIEDRKKRVHTMEKAFFGLMGCNMDLSTIKKRLKLCKDGEIYLSDTVGGHGVVFLDHTRNGWLFLETDKDKYDALRELKKLDKPRRPKRYSRR
jgi:hypothetical protein